MADNTSPADIERLRELARWHAEMATEKRRLQSKARAPWTEQEHARLADLHELAAGSLSDIAGRLAVANIPHPGKES